MKRINTLYVIICLLLFVVLASGNSSVISHDKQNQLHNEYQWSEPELLFFLPDTLGPRGHERDLSAYVSERKILLLKRYERRNLQGNALEFSAVVKTGIEPDGNINEWQLSDNRYQAEAPSLAVLPNGEWHAIWGERREDPDFEEFEGVTRLVRFSTSLLYQNGNHVTANPATVAYHAGLGGFGRGALGGGTIPFHLSPDQNGTLHAVLTTDIFQEERGGGFIPEITYLRKYPDDDWDSPRLLSWHEFGNSNPFIESLNNDLIVIVFTGLIPGQNSWNEVFITISEDNGENWNEPQLLFADPDRPALLVRVAQDSENRIHVIWGMPSEPEVPVSDEIWHIYSEDGGSTWSKPELFFVMEKSPEVLISGIPLFDLVPDDFGCLHWFAHSVKIHSGGTSDSDARLAPRFHSRWCANDKRWRQTETLDFIKGISHFAAALDKTEQRMYLFWSDEHNDGRKAMYYSSKLIRDPNDIELPIIAQSGPLHIHPNFPNPFNHSTVIAFTLEEPGEIELTVYDMNGRRILHQFLGSKLEGRHFHELNMSGLSSGNYIYDLTLNGTWRQQDKMVFVK